ncbi:MAG: signal peptidase II [Candidatus Falkowbacteria bacterium]
MCFKYFKSSRKTAARMLAAVFFIALDRFFKFLAVGGFFGEPKAIIGDFLKLNFVRNYNIAFSLPLAGWWLNIAIILIVLALIYNLLYYAERNDQAKSYLLFLIVLGAASNLFDRLKYGFVIDYFDLKYFTVFNLADIIIVSSVIFLAWLMFRNKKSGYSI